MQKINFFLIVDFVKKMIPKNSDSFTGIFETVAVF